MDLIIIALLAVCTGLLILLAVKEFSHSDRDGALRQEINSSVKSLAEILSESQRNSALLQSEKIAQMNQSVTAQLSQFEQRLRSLEETNGQKLEAIRSSVSKQLNYIQEDNNKKLEEIRSTVDEKLQKTLEERISHSFELVSSRLEEVYKGLGEMQSLAAGVGDLKKVLSNVKTRGILGEIQLGAILSEILSPEQYDTEVPTIPSSKERVEFAVKLPAADDGKFIYLPIDSKFPGDTYAALQEAYQSGSADEIKAAYKDLETVIKKCAKDIHDKYICPPYTTNFAVMFLPFEGLYAEAVNHGLLENLQRSYNVSIAGPSTMAALLNSLQMGFRTLQIQKRSSEVWQVLGEVKSEFGKFEEVLGSARTRIRQLDDELDKLVGVRTRAINRKLGAIEKLSPEKNALTENKKNHQL